VPYYNFPFLSTSEKTQIKGNSLHKNINFVKNPKPQDKKLKMLPLFIIYVKYTECNRIII